MLPFRVIVATHPRPFTLRLGGLVPLQFTFLISLLTDHCPLITAHYRFNSFKCNTYKKVGGGTSFKTEAYLASACLRIRSLPRYLLTSLPCAPLLARADRGPAGEDGGGEATAGGEFAANETPFGANGGDDVAENLVDGVFVEDAQAAVGEQVHF